MEKFQVLGISEHVLKVVSAKKFTEPSEIQKKTIPLILEGKDVIAGSATGSGKTLAFAAGIIHNVKPGEGIQALVLTPTRELAEQVSKSIIEFSFYKKIEVVPIYGGVSIGNQIKKLSYADVVVATPGRLLDHMERNSIDLKKISFLVLDEADRMWDMGFKDDVANIVKSCSKNRQTLLFSATISGDLAEFSNRFMKSPIEISVNSYVDSKLLKQVYYDVPDNGKFSLLVHLLNNEKSHLVMIFCNTRRNADFVGKNLKLNGISAQVIHGGMEQSKRSRVMKGFDNSKVNVLVCTDVAARGLDISGISHVYNYDVAQDPKDHVHRIGRTARAGAEGIAISIIASRDYDNFSNVQRYNPDLKIERLMTPRYERIFVKFDESKGNFRRRKNPDSGGRPARRPFGGPRRDGGKSFGSGKRGSGGSPRRGGMSRGPWKSGGESYSRGSRPSGGNSRGREERGERNKRSNGEGRPTRRDGKSGYFGGGRNVVKKRNRH